MNGFNSLFFFHQGYIDLSKRRVSPEEAIKAEEKYNKAKAVNSILRHVAEKHKYPIVKLYETVGWPLGRKYPSTYEAFKLAITNPEVVFKGIETPSQAIMDEILTQISRKLTPNPVKVRADIDVTCFGYEGVDAVKAALSAGEKLNTEEVPVKVKLVAAPLFVLTSVSLDKQKAIDRLTEAIEAIRESIESLAAILMLRWLLRLLTRPMKLSLLSLWRSLKLRLDRLLVMMMRRILRKRIKLSNSCYIFQKKIIIITK